MEENDSDRCSEGHSDQNEMPEMREQTLGDCWRLLLNENYSGIQHQSIDANNFELKHALISMVQQQHFRDNPSENPNGHLSNFLELCSTIKMNGVDHDVIKLKLFPFSLRDKARSWFHNLMPSSINRWGELVEVFLTKNFPPQLTSQLKAEITHFQQGEQETLYDTRDRLRKLLRKFPQHGYELSSQEFTMVSIIRLEHW